MTRPNILFITSDQHRGDWLGDHGLVLKGPMMYDGLLRVGLILSGPGIPAGAVVDDPVSTLDLASTFQDLAGAPALRELHSRSLLPVIRGTERRDFAFDEWWLLPTRAGVELRLETVRTARHRLSIDRSSGEGELYDLEDDPGEMHNRFADPGYAVVRRELDEMARARPDDACTEPSVQVGAA